MSDLSDISSNRLHAQQPATPIEDDAIDLARIIDFLGRNWLQFAAAMVLTMACGAVLFAILPGRWQATATVEIGQMPTGTSGTAGQTAPTVSLIEPPAQAVERMKQRELMNAALTRLHIPIDQAGNAPAALFRHSLKPAVVKNTNFIRVNVSGYSPQEAHASLLTAVNTLAEAHNKLMSPIVERMKLRLADNDQQLAAAVAERVSLQKLLQGPAKPDSKAEFAPHIVAVMQLSNKEQQINRIKAERAALEDLMTPVRTYPTRVIDAVYVDPSPVFPKLPLFLAVAVMLGFGIGLGLALYREWRKPAP